MGPAGDQHAAQTDPLDASDIASLEAARVEIARLRRLLYQSGAGAAAGAGAAGAAAKGAAHAKASDEARPATRLDALLRLTGASVPPTAATPMAVEPAATAANVPTVEDSFLDLFTRTEARGSESRASQRGRADHWEPSRGQMVGGDHTRMTPAVAPGGRAPSACGTPAASSTAGTAGSPAATRNPFDDLIGGLATSPAPPHAAPPPPNGSRVGAPSNPFGDAQPSAKTAAAQSSNPFD